MDNVTLFCNNIYRLPLYGRLILFADDTTLLCRHKNRYFLEFIVNHDMELLQMWFRANHLSLNMASTVLMMFWDNGSIKVELNGEKIPKVKCTKFLGLNLDDHLTWDAHVDTIYGKLVANRHLLRTAKNMLSHDCMRAIYYAHIRSHLMYGLLIWGSMTSSKNIKRLTNIQNSCVCLIGQKPNRYHTQQLYKDERLLPLESLIYMELCKFGHHITTNELSRPLLDLLDS